MVRVLEAYLSVFATGQFQEAQNSMKFDMSNFDSKRAENDSPVFTCLWRTLRQISLNRLNIQVLEICRLFVSDAVLIWAALLLKKRIFVISDLPATMLGFLRVRVNQRIPVHVQSWQVDWSSAQIFAGSSSSERLRRGRKS